MKYTLIICLLFFVSYSIAQQVVYTMPEESETHEGTWLAWPHDYTYGFGNRALSEQIWIEMTKALSVGERVHIIAYDQAEQDHITQALQSAGVNMAQVDFFQFETDDYWMRDNGPIYVYDADDNLHLTDWDFNGWGNRAPFRKDELVPQLISTATGNQRVDVTNMVLEGGSIEVDGHGSALLCRSSVTNNNRNPGLTEAQIEGYMTENLGITNFIWLDGTPGIDITDFHIDGFARFLNKDTILTLDSIDLLDFGTNPADIQRLYGAQKINGGGYDYVFLPQTQNNVTNSTGTNLNYKGSYINFYVANACVLVPTYNDPNDQVALNIVSGLYPDKNVIGIDVTSIYEFGGMIHCITQQQPISKSPVGLSEFSESSLNVKLSPNPTNGSISIAAQNPDYADITIGLYNVQGQLIELISLGNSSQISHQFDLRSLQQGTYFYSLHNAAGATLHTGKFVKQ